ncbi:MAG: hypothetical protein OEV44_01745 [Spirochaetota bacterium]|nr:hypothetical protein [Spirochaetota bacterium]
MKSIYLKVIIIILILFTNTNFLISQEVSLIAKNPIKDSFFNTHLDYSIVNIFALGNETLFKGLGSNKYTLVRLGEFLIFSYLTAFVSSMSHELSHYRVANYHNLSPIIEIHAFGGMVSHYHTDNINVNINTVTAGLNQQEFNSQFIYEKIVLSGSITYYNGINFMMNHFGTLAYAAVTLGGYDSKGNDILNYEKLTEIKGHKISRNRMLVLSSLSVFSNLVIWQDFLLFHDFIAYNKRKTKLLIFWKTIAPPLINYFLTSDGDFLYLTLPFVKPNPIFFSIGLGLEKSMFRIGTRIYALNSQYFKIIPFFYYNKIDNNFAGHQAGFEVQLHPIPNKLNLFVIGKHSERDIIDALKIEAGYQLSIGTAYTF